MPNKPTQNQAPVRISEALETLGTPQTYGTEVEGGMRRAAGRVVRWFSGTPTTETSRKQLESVAERWKNVLEGRDKNPQRVAQALSELEGARKTANDDFLAQLKASQDERATYGNIPESTLKDLRSTWTKVNEIKRKMAILQMPPQPPRPQPAPPRPAPRPPQPAPPQPAPPQPPRPIPVPRPQRLPQPTPPQPPQPAPPSPSPRPPQPTPPQPAPQPPQPPRAPEEQPDRTKELEELERELEEQNQQHQEQHDQFDELTEQLRESMREMGKNEGLNDFKTPDEEGFPPPPTDKLSPSMDDQKKGPKSKETGGQKPLFTVEPPLQGYYRVSVLDSFDMNSITWEEKHRVSPYPANVSVPREHTIKGKIRGTIALPLPAGYLIDPTSLQKSSDITITWDDRGIVYLTSVVPQEFSVSFGKAAKQPGANQGPARFHQEDIVTGSLSAETEALIQQVKTLPEAERAAQLAEYVQNKLEYSQEEAYNFIYKSDPATYYQKIEQHKKADCDVANGYFVALCRRAGLAARLNVGHRVDGSRNGKAELTTSGHAWSEIWDGTKWLTIDATPPGEQEEGGDALDTGNPEAGIDLPTEPKPKREHPHDQSQQMEKALEEAKQKNLQRQLKEGELQDLENRKDALEEAQNNEIQKRIKENADLLETEADRLQKEGKTQEAADLRQKAADLKRALNEFKKDPADSDKQEALRNALENARDSIQSANRILLAQQRLKLMQQRAAALEAEAAEGGDDDII